MNIYRKKKQTLLYKVEELKGHFSKMMLKLNGARVGKGFKCRGKIEVLNEAGNIIIGDDVIINSSHRMNPLNNGHKTSFWLVGNSTLKIGKGSGLSNVGVICADRIEIGERVLIGAGTMIFDSDCHPLSCTDRNSGVFDLAKIKKKPIIIGDDTFIGAGCTIMKGTKIGRNCVIGANSVVSGTILDNQIWAGNPARYVRDNKE